MMRSGMSCIVAGLLVIGLAAVSPALAEQEFPDDWFWGNPEQRARLKEMVGKPMPELKLADWYNEERTAEDLKGKIVVIDFWATWCGPCIGAIPKNNELHAKYREQGVELIGICSSRGQEKMEEVAREHNIQYPTAKDPDQKTAEAWQVMWWPTYAVVDREGTLRAIGIRTNRVEDVLKQLLEESPAEAVAASD